MSDRAVKNDGAGRDAEKCRARGPKPPQCHGVLVLNKPKGPSSAQHIARVKRELGQAKIGHAGTLDPMARGVLLVLLGQGTKLSNYLMGGKVYSGCLKLGESTDTWDAEGEVTATGSVAGITPERVEREILAWREISEQEVPPFSAAKHKGQPLYRLARQGRETPVKTKNVIIDFAEMLNCELPFIRFRVGCGSGTYIRSLAHSLGIRLGCGAVLTELVREYSHPFPLETAHELEKLLEHPETLAECVVPIEKALRDRPLLLLNREQEQKVRNGAALPYDALPAPDENRRPLPFAPGMGGLFMSESGEPLALTETAFSGSVPVWTVVRGLWN